MSEDEPNYKESQKIIGQLYPVLVSKDRQIIDGKHRLDNHIKPKKQSGTKENC